MACKLVEGASGLMINEKRHGCGPGCLASMAEIPGPAELEDLSSVIICIRIESARGQPAGGRMLCRSHE